MIRLIDTYPHIVTYKSVNKSFSLETWKDYADSISPFLYEKCYSDASEYDFEEDVAPVLNGMLYNRFERIESAHQTLSGIYQGLPARISALFSGEINIDIVYYLGLCNGAGWATTLGGKKTVLLGAEKIAELGWHEPDTMGDLVCHELAHLIHFELRSDIVEPIKQVWQLYSEGFAVRYSQTLYKEGYYHQNQNGWLNFCIGNLPEIKKEYLNRIKSNQSTSDFFGDWNQFMGVSNIGYYLGGEFVRTLGKSLSASEIASLSPEDITKALIRYLED